jgi:hypothetical protein
MPTPTEEEKVASITQQILGYGLIKNEKLIELTEHYVNFLKIQKSEPNNSVINKKIPTIKSEITVRIANLMQTFRKTAEAYGILTNNERVFKSMLAAYQQTITGNKKITGTHAEELARLFGQEAENQLANNASLTTPRRDIYTFLDELSKIAREHQEQSEQTPAARVAAGLSRLFAEVRRSFSCGCKVPESETTLPKTRIANTV